MQLHATWWSMEVSNCTYSILFHTLQNLGQCIGQYIRCNPQWYTMDTYKLEKKNSGYCQIICILLVLISTSGTPNLWKGFSLAGDAVRQSICSIPWPIGIRGDRRTWEPVTSENRWRVTPPLTPRVCHPCVEARGALRARSRQAVMDVGHPPPQKKMGPS